MIFETGVRIVALSFLSACVLAGGNANVKDLEPIVLESLSLGRVVFSARSNGCTNAEDFQLIVQMQDVSIVRIKKDRCRRMPFWQTYTREFRVDEKTKNMYLMNPLVLSK